MILYDIVTIAPPFGDGTTPAVVSGLIDADTCYVYANGDHLAFGNQYLTVIGANGVAPPVPAADPALWHLSKLAFRNRFTSAEKVGIEIAALDDPAAAMPQRALAASLRANQADLQVAAFIDLSHQSVRGGVQALESVGLLAARRASQILDTLPTDEERAQ
jgi:hypothetical protein